MSELFIFPKDKIPRGSRIILYGMGNVGKQYMAQCKKDYKVLFAVDSSYPLTVSFNHDIKVYYPNKIKEIDKDLYDYIVIAVYDKSARNYIRGNLISWGIEDKKIVDNISRYQTSRTVYDFPLQRYYIPSFSWFGEDRVVLNLFNFMGVEKPSYLDIGCNHPYEGNNTALLYLTGSNGVNVDANANCIHLLENDRPDDVNVICGVTPPMLENCKKRTMDFYLLNDNPVNALNSFSKKYMENYATNAGIEEARYHSVEVEVYTLDEIVEKYCEGTFPDLLDIDVEGLDSDVIMSCKFKEYGGKSPKIICAEALNEKAINYLISQGYMRYLVTPHNHIFLRKDYMNKIVLM